jgi:general secretion pathway protein F
MRVDLRVVRGRDAPHLLCLEAASVDDAAAVAIQRGYAVLGASGSGSWLAKGPSIRRGKFNVVVFVEQLRDLLGAGLSVIEALETLRRGSTGAAADSIEALEGRLREGKSLSQALAESENFPDLLIALVRASELTSDLPQTLARFLEHERRVAEIRHRLVSTAIYPLLLIAVGGAVLLFLLFYVMPRFARVFDGMSGELPWSARAMVGWARFLHSSGAWWLAGGAFLAIAILASMATSRGRAAAARRIMALAPLRNRLRIYFLARWFRANGMLVEGGIPLASSLGLANGLLPLALRPQGEAVEQGVRQGLSPSQAHVRAGMATPVAEQLLLAGERTGDLGAVLSRIAHFHEAEVTRSLEQTMRALEPLVMVLIGVGVGVVVVLMYMPIFELASAIK